MSDNLSQTQGGDRGVIVNYTFLIGYLVALSAFGSFVNDMYIPALPSMRHAFDCSVVTAQMGLTTGMAGLGIGQIIMGPISDRYGRKIILMASISLFIVAAVVSVFSPTIHFFNLCRLVQGIGAAGGYFLARTIPADLYKGRALARTMAVVGSINGFAPASAPVIGGFVSQHYGWQGAFVVLAVIGAMLLLFSFRLRETLPAGSRLKGSVLSAFAGYDTMLANRTFMTHVMLKGAALGILFAYISSAPFIMQEHYGFRQDVFGCIMGANALLSAAGSMVALRFKQLRQAAFAGAVILTVSTAAECVALVRFDSFIAYETLLLPMLFSLGMLFTSGNTLAMNEGRGRAGVSSAILGVSGYLFGAVASPLVGMGDMMHSTAIVFMVLAMITMYFARQSRRLPADVDC